MWRTPPGFVGLKPPRILVALLLASCGARDSDPSTGEAASGSRDDDASTSSDDELDDSADETTGGDDGPPPIEPCAEAGQYCPEGTVCHLDRCLGQPAPPCEDISPVVNPVSALAGARSITFADLTGSGTTVLVGVFEDRLRVVDGAGDSTDTLRGPATPDLPSPVAAAAGPDSSGSSYDVVASLGSNAVQWHPGTGGLSLGDGTVSDLPFAGARGLVLQRSAAPGDRHAFVWSDTGAVFLGPTADAIDGGLLGDSRVRAALWFRPSGPGFDAEGLAVVVDNVGFGGVATTTVGRLRGPGIWEPWTELEGASSVGLVDISADHVALVTDHTFDPHNAGEPFTTVWSVSEATGTWPFATLSGSFDQVVGGSFTGSGAIDLMMFGSDGAYLVLDATSGGVDEGSRIDCASPVKLDGPVVATTAGDFDGDGRDEVAVLTEMNGERRVSVLEFD